MTVPDDLSALDNPPPGIDPIDRAALTIAICIGAARVVTKARRYCPDAYPEYNLGVDDPSVSRNIIARLLNAGWTPPA
jgi:hypothetical protein